MALTGQSLCGPHVCHMCVVQGFQPPMLVFVQSKERAKELFHELVYDGINIDVIHADRTQQQVPMYLVNLVDHSAYIA